MATVEFDKVETSIIQAKSELSLNVRLQPNLSLEIMNIHEHISHSQLSVV